jgi:hypothetical protein
MYSGVLRVYLIIIIKTDNVVLPAGTRYQVVAISSGEVKSFVISQDQKILL